MRVIIHTPQPRATVMRADPGADLRLLPADKATGNVAVYDRFRSRWRGWRRRGNLRPVNVRLASRTRGHALVVMMAYWIVKELSALWVSLDVTVEEGPNELDALCSTEVSIADGGCFHRILEPRELSHQLLEATSVTLPTALPSKGIIVATKKKLPLRRKAA